jgi:hypothetical protein
MLKLKNICVGCYSRALVVGLASAGAAAESAVARVVPHEQVLVRVGHTLPRRVPANVHA